MEAVNGGKHTANEGQVDEIVIADRIQASANALSLGAATFTTPERLVFYCVEILPLIGRRSLGQCSWRGLICSSVHIKSFTTAKRTRPAIDDES